MLRDELTYRILQEFRFEPTDGQREVIDVFTRFLTDDALNSPPSSLKFLSTVFLKIGL